MKKLISLFLCALMILSLFATAFAAPTEDNDGETVNGATQPGTESVSPCAANGNCGNHTWVLYDASCDGYWQTWYYRCGNSNCDVHKTDLRRCPGNDHRGGCRWLPI